jgi:hypothetical protein
VPTRLHAAIIARAEPPWWARFALPTLRPLARAEPGDKSCEPVHLAGKILTRYAAQVRVFIPAELCADQMFAAVLGADL